MISVNGKQYYSTDEVSEIFTATKMLVGQFLKVMNVEVLRNPKGWAPGITPGNKYWLRTQVDELARIRERNAAAERICKDVRGLAGTQSEPAEEPDEG